MLMSAARAPMAGRILSRAARVAASYTSRSISSHSWTVPAASRSAVVGARRTVVQPATLALPVQRAFSTGNFDLVLRQADSALATVAKARELMLAAKWNDVDAEDLEDMVEGVGRGRDLVNSLSAEEAAVAEADKGLVTTVESAEAMLAAVVKCDELAHEAKDLRMEMEDLGTTGDGDNKPEAFKPHWQVRFSRLMNEYASLLDTCDAAFIGKVERDCGYQLLLLKRVVHVDHFRYAFPKVHPSGFSASAD